MTSNDIYKLTNEIYNLHLAVDELAASIEDLELMWEELGTDDPSSQKYSDEHIIARWEYTLDAAVDLECRTIPTQREIVDKAYRYTSCIYGLLGV